MRLYVSHRDEARGFALSRAFTPSEVLTLPPEQLSAQPVLFIAERARAERFLTAYNRMFATHALDDAEYPALAEWTPDALFPSMVTHAWLRRAAVRHTLDGLIQERKHAAPAEIEALEQLIAATRERMAAREAEYDVLDNSLEMRAQRDLDHMREAMEPCPF
jgi:hypothetical protein